jgi:outer membrane murein-binding lipoprotein Lpp
MKKAKRTIALLLAIVIGVILLAGCGDKEDENKDGKDGDSSNGAAAVDGSSYGIDLASEEVQQMASERASKEQLNKTAYEWLEGNTMFYDSTLTYKDFIDFIGCDASEYYFDSSYNSRVYTWKAGDSDVSSFGIWLVQKGNAWVLSMSGSANLQ